MLQSNSIKPSAPNIQIIFYICEYLGPNHPLDGILNSMNQKVLIFSNEEKDYVSPAIRTMPVMTEFSFLQSNLEPIDGGDDPEIDW